METFRVMFEALMVVTNNTIARDANAGSLAARCITSPHRHVLWLTEEVEM